MFKMRNKKRETISLLISPHNIHSGQGQRLLLLLLLRIRVVLVLLLLLMVIDWHHDHVV